MPHSKLLIVHKFPNTQIKIAYNTFVPQCIIQLFPIINIMFKTGLKHDYTL